MPTKLTSWSISRYHDYQQCPAKAKFKHIDKIKEPQNEAMERGSKIHALAENYIKGEIETLPPELEKFRADFEMLKKRFAKVSVMTLVEDAWAYTKAWAITTWNDWTGCWLRVKIDVAWEIEDGVLCVTDWKTGKYREAERVAYEEQLELYALAAFLHPSLEHIHTVKARLVYLDLGIEYPSEEVDKARLTFRRQNKDVLRKAWEKRVKAMLSDTKFSPKPNKWCGYCHFRKANGGPCSL